MLRVLAWVVFAFTLVLAIFFTFFALANIIASPFNDILSRKYEELVTGVNIPGEMGIAASVVLECKRLLIYLVILI